MRRGDRGSGSDPNSANNGLFESPPSSRFSRESFLPLPRSQPAPLVQQTNATWSPFATSRARPRQAVMALGSSSSVRPTSSWPPVQSDKKSNWFTGARPADSGSDWSIFGSSYLVTDVSSKLGPKEVSRSSDNTGDIGTLTRSTSATGNPEVIAFHFAERWKCDVVRAQSDTKPSTTGTLDVDPLLYSNRSAAEGDSFYLYLTCHLFEFEYSNDDEAQIPASINISVYEPMARVGGRPQVVFEHTAEHTFSSDSEFFHCPFPGLEYFFANPEVAKADAFRLCVQIQSPNREVAPANLNLYDSLVVPRSLMTGLGHLIDDPTSGNVRIFLIEKGLKPGSDEDRPIYRRRCVYAHSAILTARSTYFDAMLGPDSTWSEKEETECVVGGLNRRLHNIRVLDCDFATFCWILRWIYTDEIRFQKHVDARVGPDCFPSDLLDTLPTGGKLGWTWQELNDATRLSRKASVESQASSVSAKTTGKRSTIPSRRNVSANAGRVSPVSPISSKPPTSPHPQYASFESALDNQGGEDPHSHPFHCTDAASPLSIFRTAHLFGLTPLAKLAMDHMVQELSPQTAFPLFLATHLYQDLSSAIQNFISLNYAAVVSSDEFMCCIQEVAMGLWPASGELLHDFLKSLSPSPVRS